MLMLVVVCASADTSRNPPSGQLQCIRAAVMQPYLFAKQSVDSHIPQHSCGRGCCVLVTT